MVVLSTDSSTDERDSGNCRSTAFLWRYVEATAAGLVVGRRRTNVVHEGNVGWKFRSAGSELLRRCTVLLHGKLMMNGYVVVLVAFPVCYSSVLFESQNRKCRTVEKFWREHGFGRRCSGNLNEMAVGKDNGYLPAAVRTVDNRVMF